LAEESGRLAIPFVEVGLVGFALRHEPNVGAQPIDLIRSTTLGTHAKANPNHSMLHRVDHEPFEGVEFIP
jgi:hypothetical protein